MFANLSVRAELPATLALASLLLVPTQVNAENASGEEV
jgi:hypothetical protein